MVINPVMKILAVTLSAFLWCALGPVLIAAASATAQSTVDPTTHSPFLERPLVDTQDPLVTAVELPVLPGSATDFALEFSTDLQHWVTFRNYHVQGLNLVTIPASASNPDSTTRRFYRMRIPGDLPDAKLAEWQSRGIGSYRYHYAPRIGFCNCIDSAMVTVRNGAVVSVTDAVRASGAPEPNPNLTDFPTIEALFDVIKNAEQSSDLVWVGIVYDPILSYPLDMTLWANPDWSHGFVVSDFEVLP